MRLMWFHLMPYTELPEDFRDKHPSVWVDIHSSLFDPRRAHHMYNDFMDELEFAADCGFDAVCVNEHHSNGYGLMPSPNLIASSLARRTTDTAICVMGNSLALYNPPTRVAEEFAMIDCISGGRLIAGFPVGSPMDTCYAYGQNPSLLRDRYHEAHDLVLRAWTERDTFAFNGRFNQQRYVNIWPRPMQTPASADLGPRRRLDRNLAVVRRDGLRLLLPLLLRLQDRPRHDGRFLGRNGAARQGPQSIPRRLRANCRRRRKPPARHGPLHRSRRILLRPLPAHRSALRRPARLHNRSQRSAWACKARSPRPRPIPTSSSKLAREMDAIVENGYVIIGSPDEVVEQMREVANNLNVGNLMLLLQFGNMSKELTKYNSRLFADAVMPKLKPLFAEWEHRWWPQPNGRRATRRGSRLRAAPGRRIDARHHDPLLHRRRRAGRHDAGLPARARRHRCGGAGEARRLPARFPRRHGASLHHAGDARARAARRIPRQAAQRGA